MTTSTVHVQSARSLAAVLEMGSFLDLGDTHIMVLWEEPITVLVNQENTEEYSLK